MTAAARRALVTGGSSGIGRGIARTLARDGCDVGIVFVGSPRDADGVRGDVAAFGRRFWLRPCDVRRSEEVNAAVESFVAEMGGLDILVNNAGVFRDQVSWKMSDDEWREVLGVDLDGMFFVCRAAIPVLRQGGGGAVVNISSINGLRGKFGQANYAAAKAGVIGLTKTLARECAKFNITVNAVAPGLIETPAIAAMTPQARADSLAEILLGRAGRVEDVADLVAFLCSDRARFITGEVIRVDGGQYI